MLKQTRWWITMVEASATVDRASAMVDEATRVDTSTMMGEATATVENGG